MLGRIYRPEKHPEEVYSIFFKTAWFFSKSTDVDPRQETPPATTLLAVKRLPILKDLVMHWQKFGFAFSSLFHLKMKRNL